MISRPRLAPILALTCLATLVPQARAARRPPDAPPGMYSVPAAARPGAATDVAFYNAPAGAPTGLWTSFPADVAPVAAAGESRVRITLPADAQVGIHAVRLGTTSGASDLQLFMVDDLPSAARAGGNTSSPAAQSLGLPIAVDGACDPLAADYYRFPARAGQRLAFEVVARRLGSRLDAVLRVLDPAGREVAYGADTPGLGGDCRFAHTFAADGVYLLELHDAEYQGGADRRYRLRIGDFPAVTVAFPLGVKRGSTTSPEFEGTCGAHADPVPWAAPPPPATQASIAVRDPAGGSSTFVPVCIGDADDFVAPTPNHSRAAAAPVTVPVAISGRFAAPGTIWDDYSFDAKNGQRLIVRGRTRSLGSAANLRLEVLKPDGNRLAESKLAGADEGLLDVPIPADGRYCLAAAELAGLGGPAVVYRLEVEWAAPSFELSVETEKFDATAGGTFRLKVKCARHGYDGPVALSLDGDAAAFKLANAVIPADKAEADVDVTVPADQHPGRPLAFRVVGTATIGGAERAILARTTLALAQRFPRLTFPPPELDGLIGLGIRAP